MDLLVPGKHTGAARNLGLTWMIVSVRPAVLRGPASPCNHDWKLIDTSASTAQGIASLPRKVRLLPRRKRRSSIESPKEVVLGMNQISSLFHLPQCEAAQRMVHGHLNQSRSILTCFCSCREYPSLHSRVFAAKSVSTGGLTRESTRRQRERSTV